MQFLAESAELENGCEDLRAGKSAGLSAGYGNNAVARVRSLRKEAMMDGGNFTQMGWK